MNYDSQCERLREHLKRFGSITALEALSELGIGRCAARIKDLRNEGLPIETQSERVGTRHGVAVVARYVLNRPVQLAWFENERRAG